MYFRFPIMLLLVALVIIGAIFVMNRIPTASAPRMVAPPSLPMLAPSELRPSDTIRTEDLKAHLEFLADDLLKGRDTGSPGSKIASLYVAKQFEKYGLKPLGGDDSFFQDIQFSKVTATPKSTMEIEVDGEMINLRYGQDFFISGFPSRSAESISATMVFTGYGIEAKEYNYSDFENINVNKCVTVFMAGEPRDGTASFFEGDDVASHYALMASKHEMAKKKGAVASINIIQPGILENTDWDSIRSFYQDHDTRIRDQSLAYPSIVLHPKAGELLFSGTAKDFESICREGDQGRFTSFETGKKVKLTIHFEENTLSDRNVIAELPGSDPILLDQSLIFCAHYDHVGVSKAVEGDSIYNGAIDNASGISALLELAEAFSTVNPAPARSVLFIAFTAEEKGLLGSKYYCRYPTFPIGKTIGVINIDMIGMGDSTGIVVYGQEKSTIGETIERAANATGLTIIQDELPELRIFYRSDHYNFDRQNVPSVLTGFGLRRNNQDEYQRYYHQPIDDTTLPINYNYMRKHTVVLLTAGLELANTIEKPSWKGHRP